MWYYLAYVARQISAIYWFNFMQLIKYFTNCLYNFLCMVYVVCFFKVDHDLSRTVLVTTKLDTKLPQFGSGEDLEDFLR